MAYGDAVTVSKARKGSWMGAAKTGTRSGRRFGDQGHGGGASRKSGIWNAPKT